MCSWRVLLLSISAISLLGVVSSPTAQAAPAASHLPLTRVRLYETGVGYFERSGLAPRGDTTLPVPAGHLDDALKTLVILGGDVKVSGVAFSSSVSRDMARTLAGLPIAGEAPLSFTELARSFKGAVVTLSTSSGVLNGRLVEVLDAGQGELERCADVSETDAGGAAAPRTCHVIERGSLVVLTGTGELRRVATADVFSLRPTEAAARARLDSALDALSQRGAQTRRELGVLASNGGKVTLGYVAETPVWRSTYRIVIGSDRAKLQGWALLHNDTDEDWRGVQVDLVNGRPTSFLYPLAAPRYARRELVTPPEELPSVPQLFDTTVDNLWAGGLGLSGVGEGGGGRAEGFGFGSVGIIGRGHGVGLDPQSDQLSIGNLAQLAPAEGVEAAALFRYTLPTNLALQAHASALVPFLDASIKVRQVAWFARERNVAASALHVTNDTAQTLPAGTVSVFAEGGFAGESLLPRTKPRQSHVLGYGTDLDLELERAEVRDEEESRLFELEGDELTQHYVRRRAETLSIKNRSRSARTAYVQLDVVDNARVEGAKELGRDAESGNTYAVIEVPAGEEASERLTIEEGLRRAFALAKLTSAALRGFAAIPTTVPGQRAALQRAAELLAQAERRRGALPKRQVELEQALADVARVRENARILGAARAKQAETMAERVVELETKVTELRARIAELSGESDGFVASARRELARL